MKPGPVCSRNPFLVVAEAKIASPPPLGSTGNGPHGGRFSRLGSGSIDRLVSGRVEAGRLGAAGSARSGADYVGGVPVGSMTSALVPVRRRARVCLGLPVGWRFVDLSLGCC